MSTPPPGPPGPPAPGAGGKTPPSAAASKGTPSPAPSKGDPSPAPSKGAPSPTPSGQPTGPGGFPPHPRYAMHSSDFDFTAHRQIPKPTNVLESAVHLVKGALGGGIMGVHEAYAKAGLWTSLVLTFLFGLYISYCVQIIVNSAQCLYKRLHVTEMSYPDVAEASLHFGPFPRMRKHSKKFRYAVDFIICFDLFGSCCVYQIMISKTIIQLIHTISGESGNIEPGKNEIRIYIAAILIPILLICMIRSLKYLAPFSLVANIFIVLCVIATIYYGMTSPIRPPIEEMPIFGTWGGLFQFCGVVVFSMEGVGVALPIENNMRYPNHFPWALTGGMSIIVGFVILVGFFGYWGFVDKVTSPVTLNFPADAFPTVIKGLMGLMIYVTFALNFWAPFNLVWYYIAKKYNPEKHWIWERVYRTIIIIVITLIAIAFPNIGSLMGLLGGFCLSLMGFIFPAVIETLVVWEKPGLGKCQWKLWKNVLICVLGFILCVSSTYTNAYALFSK